MKAAVFGSICHLMNKPTVIQVEDDPNDVFLFSRAFKRSGIDADLRSFDSGEGLISYLNSAADSSCPVPLLVLLDIKLPRQSGFEVLEWMRSHPLYRRLPTVMLTSSSQPHDVKRAYDIGANGYLVKPMDIDDTARLLSAISGFWLQANVSPMVAEANSLAPAPAQQTMR